MDKLTEKHKKIAAYVVGTIILGTFGYFAMGRGGAQSAPPLQNATTKESSPATPPAVPLKSGNAGTIDYSEASSHVGQKAQVTGTPIKVYKSPKGTVFFDYCPQKDCPFSVVIFGTDAKKFKNIENYADKETTITGTITSYNGATEIVVTDPSQIK